MNDIREDFEPVHARPTKRAQAIQQIRRAISEGRLQDAYESARKLVARNKRDAEAHFLIGLIAEQTGQTALARSHATTSLQLREHADTLFLLSRIDRQTGNTDDALDTCDRALSHNPRSVPLLIHRAATLEEAGRFVDARAVVDPLIQRFEDEHRGVPAPLRFELAKLLVHDRNYEAAIEVIDDLVADSSTPTQLRRLTHYLQAKAFDRAGRYDDAFAAASAANKIDQLAFDPTLYEAQVSVLIEQWTAARLDRFPIADCDSELPVFIAGMPRSGTSLIDQIIDAHPRASGVGELSALEHFAQQLSAAYNADLEPPKCFGRYDRSRWSQVARKYVSTIRKQSPATSVRIVNKALGNNKLVGLLACLFPKTRVIHAMRDPRDVAISCYMGGFNNQVHPWTTRLDWVAAAWEQSLRMMDHWKDVLDIPILDVQYERLVTDPDRETRRLIEFLGLDWDPACLEFHRSTRTVRTLSYDQVNRPLYTTSVGRHTKYASHMGNIEFPDRPDAH
ncbi:MAG: sulfotransferase [Planctomycetota bacterium]